MTGTVVNRLGWLILGGGADDVDGVVLGSAQDVLGI